MGRQKLLARVDGQPLIRRALAAASNWPTVVVASAAVEAELAGVGVRVVRNDEPERGMSHSLRCGAGVLPPDEPFAVLLADMPDCDAAAIARVVAAYDDTVDVVVPRAGARFGHPVVFGPRAIALIAALPEGDTIQKLRDDPTLRRRIVDVPDARAFVDIDTEADLAARLGQTSQGTSA
jgi:molybdenum cofactor cytidylyltransferase